MYKSDNTLMISSMFVSKWPNLWFNNSLVW